MAKTKVGIINVTGYAGVELARLLCQHPEVELASVTGRSAAGQELDSVFPHLSTGLTIEAGLGDVDLAFSAMPHKESAAVVKPLLDHGIRVVDISADFRLKDADAYPQWYDFTHPAPRLLEKAAYGLTELYRPLIKPAQLVANPGCYPTGAILALAPVVKAGLIEPDIIIDSKSGISGAGRSLSQTTHYAEASEDTTAYALDGHRHLPEIVQELALLNRKLSLAITFVPHLIPMTRGILTNAYSTVLPGKIAGGKKGEEELLTLYRDYYKDEPFVKVDPAIDRRTGRLIVISSIDNLVKGAAGQAVQNMNLMLDLPETTGLQALAIYP